MSGKRGPIMAQTSNQLGVIEYTVIACVALAVFGHQIPGWLRSLKQRFCEFNKGRDKID